MRVARVPSSANLFLGEALGLAEALYMTVSLSDALGSSIAIGTA